MVGIRSRCMLFRGEAFTLCSKACRTESNGVGIAERRTRWMLASCGTVRRLARSKVWQNGTSSSMLLDWVGSLRSGRAALTVRV